MAKIEKIENFIKIAVSKRSAAAQPERPPSLQSNAADIKKPCPNFYFPYNNA